MLKHKKRERGRNKKFFYKLNKSSKGITLIALVITIIVLLILAGVTIATLMGDNGILTKATDAKEKTIIGEEKEAINLAYTACKSNDVFNNITDVQLQEELEKIKDNVQVSESGEDLIVLFKDTKHRYKIDENGKIEQLDNLNSDEDSKIVDLIESNLAVTQGGKVIYIETTEITENNYEILNINNETVVTDEGVKKSTQGFFIDNAGKVYEIAEENSLPICISDLDNVLNGKNIIDICSDYSTVIGLDDNGKIYTWGYNYNGELGNGNFENSDTPICISDLDNCIKGKEITNIYMQDSTIAVIDKQGKVYTWGNNDNGQLGSGSAEVRLNTPICINDIKANALQGKIIKDIYLEYGRMFLIDTDGKVYACGENEYGELGNGNTNNTNTLICISDLENDLNGKNIIYIMQVYVNLMGHGEGIIALDNEGKLYTWGENSSGQLGDGKEENRSQPLCISDLDNDLKGKNIEKLYNTYGTIMTLDNNGKVYAWGKNWSGELGDGTYEYRNIPICISELENDLKEKKIIDIKMSGYKGQSVIALDDKGNLYTWGSSQAGLLGDNSTSKRNTPICITENPQSKVYNKNVIKVLEGHNIVYFITNDGEIIYNRYIIDI